MACERFGAALEQGALGEPPTPELEAHLTVCMECRAALDERRRLLAAVDRLVETALAVEPSPGFAARVRRRVAEEPTRSPVPAVALAAALVVAAIAGIVVVSRGREAASPTAAAPRVAVVRNPPASPAAPPAERPEPQAPRRVAPHLALGSAASPAPADVLVPAGQAQALLAFENALRARRIDVASLATTDLERGTDIPKALELAVRPLEVEPLRPARIAAQTES